MKILTINVNKGGAGKTTLSHNLAEYLALTHRVLLIDFDDSCNLTHRYGSFMQRENTVISLFEDGRVTPIQLEPHHLDLIAGSKDVERLKENLISRRRREYIFGKWLAENYESLEAAYDYLIIDTENDEGLLTLNALLVSDGVIGIAEASKDSVVALRQLAQFVSGINQEFDIQLPYYFIANKINLSETASKDLLDTLKSYSEYVGYLPRRTLLANEASLFHLKKNEGDPQLLEQVTTLFEALIAKIEEDCHAKA